MSHPNASTAMAVTLVDELVRCGVAHAVVAPGSRSAALSMALARHPSIKLTVEIDERSAGFFAVGVGRSTGHPAVVVTTSGSAVANLLPAVVEAGAAMVPLLVLTADRPGELHDVGANQTMPQDGIFGAHTRWAASLGAAEHRHDAPAVWRTTIDRAVAEARRGPVHVNVAFREPLVPETDDGRSADDPFEIATDGRADGRPWTDHVPPVPRITELSERWTGVERGLVVAGEAPGVPLGAIDRLAAALGWPLICEPTAGGRPSQAISTAHHLVSDPVMARHLTPEVALVIGRVGLSRPLARMLAEVPVIVVDPRAVNPGRRAVETLAGWPVVESIGSRGGDWRRLWLAAEAAGRDALDRALDASGWSEPRIARDVADATGADGVLVAASSMPIRDLEMTMRPGGPAVVSNRGLSGIDGFVSTAHGVAAGLGRPVVALGGDLAILHDSNGFLADPLPDVVHVVVDNDGGGIFSFLPQARQTDVFERVFGTPHGRSFAELAAFHGLRTAPLTDVASQVPAAVDAGGTWLFVAGTDRGSNPAVHREITDAVAAAARSSVEG